MAAELGELEAGVDYIFASGSEICGDCICPVRNKVMLDPYQTECCSNHISSSIAEKLMKEGKPCPLCHAPTPANTPKDSNKRPFVARTDGFFQKKILNLEVCCPHSNEGCDWVGTLKAFQSHTLSCNMRPWKCQHCDFQSRHLVSTEHAQKCPKRPVQCACDASSIPFCDYDAHLETCAAQRVSCEFAHVGCACTFLRSESSQHMRERMSQHQLLVSQQSLKMITELKAKFDDLGTLGVQKQEEEVSESQKEAGKLQEAVEMKEDEVCKLKEELERKEAAISKLEGAVTKLKAKVGRIEEEKREQNTSIKSSMVEHSTLMERKEGEIQKLQQRHELTERQVQRFQSEFEQRDDDLRMLRQGGVGIGNNALESLQAITISLKHKRSLKQNEVAALVSQLEEVVAKTMETVSLSSNDCESPVNLVGGAVAGAGNPPFCRGKLVRVVVKDLKKAWGVAMGEGRLYAVDNGGSYGLHVTTIDTDNREKSSMETMIASATIGEVTVPPGKCWYPRGVALDKDGNILLVDTGTHRVLKFSPQGQLLAEAGSESRSGNASGDFNCPVGIAVSPVSGQVYVCDRFNHRVQVLGPKNLEFLKEFGESGMSAEQFTNPWDVAIDKEGNAYVADCGNRCVKVFTPELSLARTIGKGGGRYKRGDLRAPSCLCVDDNGFLYVADMGLRCVLVYDALGNFRQDFGRFSLPYGIAADKKGHVYVSDNGGGGILNSCAGRVQMFL